MNLPITNVSHYLRLRAQNNPHTNAIIDPSHNLTITFEELEQKSNGIAQKFQQLGLKKSTRVLLLLKPSAELLAIAFALFKIGAIPIIIDPGMGIKNFIKCVKISKPQALIGTPIAFFISQLFFRTFQHIKLRIPIRRNKFLNSIKSQNNFILANTLQNDLAAILFTSGSTGSPKGVNYTHQIFNAQLSMIQNHYQIQPNEIDFPMLPVFALFNPALGLTTVIPEMNPSKPAKANSKKIVDSILQHEVSNSFGSPILWKKIADYCDTHNITLPSLKRIFMAGCSVPTNLILRYQKITPNAIIHTPYGATEALPITSISDKEIIQNNFHKKTGQGTCVGKPLPDCKIKIIKISDEVFSNLLPILELNQGEIGEIIVNGPNVTETYLNLPHATLYSKIYEKKINNDQLSKNCWHRMGDLGFIDSEGFLWFCGRKIERVETSDGTLFTDCCESIINQCPLINRSALIGIKRNNQTVSAIVIEPNPKNSKALLLKEVKAIAKQHPITQKIDHFYLFKKFPVDTRHNAKIHRLTLAKYFNK